MVTSATSTAADPQRPSHRRSRLACTWSGVKFGLILIALLVLIVTFTPLVPWWAHKLSGTLGNPRGDVIVVLASAESSDGILSYSSYLRSEYALRAWREGWAKAVVISGGATNGTPAADPMAQFLAAEGVPASALVLETSSRSTRENALDAKPILDKLGGACVLITSDYHMYRAQRAFAKAGIAVVPRPYPDVIKRSTSLLGRWPGFLDLCVESVKIGYYRVRGWI